MQSIVNLAPDLKTAISWNSRSGESCGSHSEERTTSFGDQLTKSALSCRPIVRFLRQMNPSETGLWVHLKC
jgi:hypothetical protein